MLATALADTDSSDQSQGRDWGADGMKSSALDLRVELGGILGSPGQLL